MDDRKGEPLINEEHQQAGNSEPVSQAVAVPQEKEPEKQECDREPEQGQPSESVQDTFIQNESPIPSEVGSQPDAARENQAESGDPSSSGEDAAADRTATDSKARMDPPQTRSTRRLSVVRDTETHVPAESAPENKQSDGEARHSGGHVDTRSNEADLASSSREEKADISPRHTRAESIALAHEEMNKQEAGPARRTRARSSSSAVSEPVELKFPAEGNTSRTHRPRRGRAEKSENVLSTGPPSSGGGRILRPRTRANSATTAATSSADTGNASDCENHDPDNIGTSRHRQAEHVDDGSPRHFVATLSPIPENQKVQRAKSMHL